MYHDEDDARPAKRQKVQQEISSEPQNSPQLTLADLLLSLPSLLLHPPTHTNHERSLALSHYALKKANTMTSLDKVVECRAAVGLAELGLQIGLSSPGIEGEIQKAITKGSLIAQNLPTLQLYRHRLALLSSQLSLASGNAKAAQSNLNRSLSNLSSNDPPHVVYTFHLSLIASISSQSTDETANVMRSLGAISDLLDYASKRGDRSVIQLASVLRLRAFMRAGFWSDVGEFLDAAESVLDMGEALKENVEEKDKVSEKQNQSSAAPLPSPPSSSKSSRTALEDTLIVHTLILGVIFYTYTGDTAQVNPRLKWLHDLLDTQIQRFPKNGIFELPFNNAPSLFYQLTHPRVIYVLGFLISSLAKRDLVGKKPKKKVFASEGLIAVDKEIQKELAFPAWASISDVKETHLRLKMLRADLTCELITAAIQRSEFDEAERLIDETISYTRNHGLFSSYIARLTLYEAQLAHALNKPKRALQCYQIAAYLSRKPENRDRRSSPLKHKYTRPASLPTLIGIGEAVGDGEEDFWLNTAARAGELWLRIGLLRQTPSTGMGEEEREKELKKLRKTGESVIKDCRGLGGTLETIAEVLDSCLTKEFVKAKTYLRRALNLSTATQDNHLRALVLSLIASHYLHTSNQHAEKMLDTAENLSAGLGAQIKSFKVQGQGQTLPAKGPSSTPVGPVGSTGDVHLRLWIGERFLELYNRSGNKEAAKVQVVKNDSLKDAVLRVEARDSG